jgi:alpha-glucosidase
MDNQADFTIDPINFPGLPAYVDEKRAQGMRYVPILDPTIASGRPGYETYDRGLASNSYILQENGEVLLGNVSHVNRSVLSIFSN